MRRRAASAFLLTAIILASSAAQAQVKAPTRLDPGVLRALGTGIVGAWSGRAPVPGRVSVLVELVQPATPDSLLAIARTGAELAQADGATLFYDRFVPAELTSPAAAVALAARPEVARVTLLAGRGPLPLDHSAALTRLEDARGSRPALDRLTGAGVVIGDVDSLCDIFHPVFFRGDAGYFDWIDVDGDGAFTPGVDAIDLDRNGAADPGEIALPIRAATYSDNSGQLVDARSPGFDPSTDWLYLDVNGNQKRDYGAAGGFDDTAPAFGEPLFVPDDLNRNGKLDVGERVVRLGTSKFRKVFIYLQYLQQKVNHVFTRGADLSKLKSSYFDGQLYGFPDAYHATGVLSIVAGDVPLAGRRWVGFAPDAELLLGWDVDSNSQLPAKATTWALKEKADVMLYEMAPWTGLPLDGSDPLSKLVDTSNQQSGVVHTCPTGDQGSARKHAHADLAAGASVSLTVDIPAKIKTGDGPLTYVDLSMHVRGGAPVAVTVVSPGGDTIDAFASATGSLATGAQFFATRQTTSRGTDFTDVVLYAADPQKPLPTGNWTVTVTADPAQAVTVDAYVSDDKSSWGFGAGWAKSIADDTSTIGVPSTADHCIAVGAEPNHPQDPNAPWFDIYYAAYDLPGNYTEKQGQVRAYSPRGPRLDGVQKPDLLAPDNPWVAADFEPTNGVPYGAFRPFGGTSGASPHVTGSAALLVQAGVKGDAARDALRAGAVSDATTGKTPNKDYGYGHLDLGGALGVKAPGQNPTLTLTVSPPLPTTADKVRLVPIVGAGDGLELRWDDDYDGTWDSEYAPVAPRAIPSDAPLTRPFRARVRNAAGHIAEAVVWVTINKASPAPPPDPGGCGCRASSEAPGAAGSLAAGAVLAALLRRRRRSSRHSQT
jgi:MYXO-CTERM domain-containing protein